MEKFIGRKWGSLSDDEKKLFENYNIWNGGNSKATSGECLVDFENGLTVGGYYITNENESYALIEDDAVIYDSYKGCPTVKKNKRKYSVYVSDEVVPLYESDNEDFIVEVVRQDYIERWNHLEGDDRYFYEATLELLDMYGITALTDCMFDTDYTVVINY